MSDHATGRPDVVLRTGAGLLTILLIGCAPGRVGTRPGTPPTGTAPAAATPAVPAGSPAPLPAPAAGPASPTPASTPARVDFAKQVVPVLQEKCSPCHFPGGRMYDRMPFDREETIHVLGTDLLPRLRDPVDQELVRTFLGQAGDRTPPR